MHEKAQKRKQEEVNLFIHSCYEQKRRIFVFLFVPFCAFLWLFSPLRGISLEFFTRPN